MNELERAAQELEERIAARQQGLQPPQLDVLNASDAALVDDIVAASREIQPDPAFIQALETRLMQQATATPLPAQRQWSDALQQWLGLPLHSPLRVALVSGVLVLLLLLVSAPTTRAALRRLFFGLAFMQPTELQEQQFAIEAPVEVPNGRPMTLNEIRARAPFAVKAPGQLPGDLSFTGGYIVETRTGFQLSQVYHRQQDRPNSGELAPGTPALLLIINTGEPDAPPLLPDAEQQWVELNGAPAVYVHGGWRAGAIDRATNIVTDVTWDSTMDDAWLTWQEGDLTYWLQADGLGFDQKTMIQIAESLAE